MSEYVRGLFARIKNGRLKRNWTTLLLEGLEGSQGKELTADEWTDIRSSERECLTEEDSST